MQFIDLQAQYRRIKEDIDQAIQRVLDHGRYIMGPEIGELENRLAEYVGSKHCICCSSGTDALLMVLLAAEVGPGDAVFTSPFTFFATAEVISLTGATPVFADISKDTYNLDVDSLDEAIKKIANKGELRPRAVISVDLFGTCADYDRLNEVADKRGLLLLQDAAQAFGAEYNGRRAPSLAPVGATSFFPAKPLGCYGDGGAVFTDDSERADLLRSIRVHGQGKDRYDNIRIGLNARMDTLQAAILLEKFKIYDREIELRQQVAARYGEQLEGALKSLPTVPAGCRSVYAQFCVESDKRDEIRAALKAENIPTSVYYAKPMHLLPAFSALGGRKGDFPVAEAASERIFALPFHPYLTEEEIDHVSRIIRSVPGAGI